MQAIGQEVCEMKTKKYYREWKLGSMEVCECLEVLSSSFRNSEERKTFAVM